MATSIMKYRDIVRQRFTEQITWDSTSNPYGYVEFDVAKNGYTPVGVGYGFTGTSSSAIYCSSLTWDKSKVYARVRMSPYTPTSTTQNSMTVNVTYMRD